MRQRNILLPLLILSCFLGCNRGLDLLNQKIEKRVIDYANILKQDERDSLFQLIETIRITIGPHIGIVIADSLNGLTIEQFANKTFEEINLGRMAYKDGVLIAMSVNEKLLRIETGQGIRDIISDTDAKNIIDDIIVPKFRDQYYFDGLLAALYFLKDRLEFCKESINEFNPNNIQFEVLNQEIRIGNTKPKFGKPCINTCADISIRLNNPTDQNYLLYYFSKSPELATELDSLYHNELILIAGIFVFVYDIDNKQIAASRYTSIDNILTPEQSEELKRKAKLVIHQGQSFESIQRVDFKDFDLEPGIYHVRLIYLQHPNIAYHVDNEFILQDKRDNNANVYIGRVWSNKVKLVVE